MQYKDHDIELSGRFDLTSLRSRSVLVMLCEFGGRLHCTSGRIGISRRRHCSDALALAGDDDGAATWCRIMTAVTELANKNPSPLRPPTSPVRT
jgi:hypothetical protein